MHKDDLKIGAKFYELMFFNCLTICGYCAIILSDIRILQKSKVFHMYCKALVIALFLIFGYNFIGYILTIFSIAIDKLLIL